MDHVTNFPVGEGVAYAREQEAIRKARFRRSMIILASIVGAMFALMVGCGVAVAVAASADNARAASLSIRPAPEPPVSAELGRGALGPRSHPVTPLLDHTGTVRT